MSDVWARAAAAFAFTGTVTPLVGERTDNASVAGPDGVPLAVLKLHQLADRSDIELEVAALQHLSAYPGLRGRMPEVVVSPAGTALVEISTPDGVRLARALTWLPGRTWRADDGLPERLAQLGRLVAELDTALASFDHPGAGRRLRWNLVEAGAVASLVDHVTDPERREAARAVLGRFENDLAPRLAALAAQVVHNDANPANIVLSTGGSRSSDGSVLGLIDFGDICRSPRICGLAVALAYAVGGALAADPAVDPRPDPLRMVLPLVAGYHEVAPLSQDELALLVPLARTRLAVSVVMAAWQHRRDPGNDYLLAAQGEVWPALQRLLAVDDHFALCRVRAAAGLEPCPRSAAVREYLSSAEVAPVLGRPLVELGYQIMDWSGPELPPQPEVTAERVLVGRYLEDRVVYTAPAFATAGGERRTVHLAVDLFRPPGSPVHAPLDGVVELCGDNAGPLDYGPVVVLRHALPTGQSFFTLYGHLSRESLDGARPGRVVAAGEAFARIGTMAENGGWAPHLHLQILTDLVGRGLDVPGVAARGEVGLWASLSPDPRLLLDLPESIDAGHGDSAGWRIRT